MTDQKQEFASPQEALAHFGVKGMKWGVRKSEESGGGKNPNPVRQVYKERRSEAKATAKADKAAIRSKNQTIGQARKETREQGKAAREIIREYRRAPSPAARKAAAKRYENEVLKPIKSQEFKAAYQKANTMGKGEMAVHALAFGPLALVTVPAVRGGYKRMANEGYELEVDMAHDILKEMRS